MGDYRSKLDIIADMLRVTSSGANKTRIMYQANLSYRLLTRYLNELVKSGLIHFEHSKKNYELTSKGKEYLQLYREYSRRNRRFERQSRDLRNKRKALIQLLSV